MAFASTAPARRPLVLGDLLPGALVRDVALVLGGVAFIGLAAQVSIPLHGTPVPITGQTFAVLLTGASLGLRRAFAATALYLLAGMAGMPWFTHHAHGLIGPSLGYVVGFVLAGSVIGWLASRGGDRTPLRTVGTMLVGTLLVYAVGVPYLMADLHVGWRLGYELGMKDFLIGDGIKVLLAAAVLPGAWRLLGRRA
jgi:biotin transport system substrate-specific component